MSKLLYSDVKNQVAAGCNLCATDPRVMEYVNRGQEELMNSLPEFVGKHIKLRVCVLNGNITWPEEIETIEAVMVDHVPYQTRDIWFEFLENAIWGQDPDSYTGSAMGLQLDRSDVVAFDEVNGENKKLKIYCDVSEAANSFIRLGGLGTAGTRIRTFVNSEWLDGERLALSNVTPSTSVNVYKTLDLAVKNVTNGYLRLYELDTTTSVERLLAIYPPWSTKPTFRRSFIPGLASTCKHTIQIIGKRRFVPARSDNDMLNLQNLNAVIEGAKMIHFGDNNKTPHSEACREKAKRSLNEQFTNWRGENTKTPMNFQNRMSWGTGAVLSFGARG